MAIERKSQAAEQNNAGANQQENAAPISDQGLDLFGVSGMAQSRIGGNSSARYEEFAKIMTEQKASIEKNKPVTIDIIELRQENTNLYYSMLLVAVSSSRHPEVGVAYHALVDAGSNKPTTSRDGTFQSHGMSESIQLHTVPSDAMDERMVKVLQATMNARYPGRPTYYADGTVLHVTMSHENKDAINSALRNAVNAGMQELQRRSPGGVDINLASMSRKGCLSQAIQFSQGTLIDPVGMPTRSDFLIDTSARPLQRNNKQHSLNDTDVHNLGRSTGFVELVYVAPNQQQQMMYNAMYQDRRLLAPLVVTTELQLDVIPTLGAVLVALASTTVAMANNNWMSVFRPTPTRNNGVDLRDIGAANIECNLGNEPSGYGRPADTKSADFQSTELIKLMSGCINAMNLSFAVDVPNMGPQSHYLCWFSQCHNENNAGEAYKAIIRAANIVTNNKFAERFPAGAPVTVASMPYLSGTWMDQDGQQRDLRDIDYLAMANLQGTKNPAILRAWTETWLQTNIAIEKRLSDRAKLLQMATNDQAVFTGRGERVVLSNQFLKALVEAIRSLEVQFQTGQVNGMSFNDQRSSGQFMAQAVNFVQDFNMAAYPQVNGSNGYGYVAGNNLRFGN